MSTERLTAGEILARMHDAWNYRAWDPADPGDPRNFFPDPLASTLKMLVEARIATLKKLPG